MLVAQYACPYDVVSLKNFKTNGNAVTILCANSQLLCLCVCGEFIFSHQELEIMSLLLVSCFAIKDRGFCTLVTETRVLSKSAIHVQL